jgi:4-hydroxy-tetrahydrodipicolinate reductase
MSENLKIALIGYGNMGKEIHSIARNQNIEVTDIFDEDNLLTCKENYQFDVAIDFSVPSAVIDHAEIISQCGKNLVIGTTGWYDKSEIIEYFAKQYDVGIVWGSNFSVGMQLFFKIINYASELFNHTEEYDVFLHEFHHTGKKDSPSGTAVTLSQIIKNSISRKTEILNETSFGEISANQLHSTSTRGGKIPGTHTVYFDSLADTIELTHRARNRSGFASGAITASKLINGKKGFFSFDILLEDMLITPKK